MTVLDVCPALKHLHVCIIKATDISQPNIRIDILFHVPRLHISSKDIHFEYALVTLNTYLTSIDSTK